MSVETWIGVIVAFLVGLIVKSFLPAYMGEKGKNLATKEDIGEITSKIETVKAEYSAQLETTKAQLSSQLKTHGFRYEKEYLLLEELTGMLVDVRNAALSLRPTFDQHDPGETDEQRKVRRLNALSGAQRELYFLREKKRPFYSAEIYDALVSLHKIANTEAIKFGYSSPDRRGDAVLSYWEEAEKNQAEIERLSDEALLLIRSRVNKWEALL